MYTDHRTGRAQWLHTRADAESSESLVGAQVDLQHRQTRGHLPDVAEGDTGEAAAVADGMRDAAQSGHDDVAERLPQVEALVAVLPDAIDAASVFRFPDQILPRHLDVWVEWSGVPFLHLWIGLPCLRNTHSGYN